MRRAQSRMKGDERILGDGEFAQSVLDAAKEQYEERYLLQAHGHDLETVAQRVSALLGISSKQVWASGKHPLTVKARSLLCYWAVRELGFTATEVSRRLGVSQPSVSISVKRGEKTASTENLMLVENQKVIISWPCPIFPRIGVDVEKKIIVSAWPAIYLGPAKRVGSFQQNAF